MPTLGSLFSPSPLLRVGRAWGEVRSGAVCGPSSVCSAWAFLAGQSPWGGETLLWNVLFTMRLSRGILLFTLYVSHNVYFGFRISSHWFPKQLDCFYLLGIMLYGKDYSLSVVIAGKLRAKSVIVVHTYHAHMHTHIHTSAWVVI